MVVDQTYAETRRCGVPVAVVQVVGSTTDPKRGCRVFETVLTNVCRAVKRPTTYSAKLAANRLRNDVGETTFGFHTRDVPFANLTTSDWIIAAGERYKVTSSIKLGKCITVTANVHEGDTPAELAAVSISQTVISGSADVP